MKHAYIASPSVTHRILSRLIDDILFGKLSGSGKVKVRGSDGTELKIETFSMEEIDKPRLQVRKNAGALTGKLLRSRTVPGPILTSEIGATL